MSLEKDNRPSELQYFMNQYTDFLKATNSIMSFEDWMAWLGENLSEKKDRPMASGNVRPEVGGST